MASREVIGKEILWNFSKIPFEGTEKKTEFECNNGEWLESISESTLSPDAAVPLSVEHKLSKSQYQGLQNISQEDNCNLYPPYKSVYEAKLKCYPLKSDTVITETKAEVKVQALLEPLIVFCRLKWKLQRLHPWKNL